MRDEALRALNIRVHNKQMVVARGDSVCFSLQQGDTGWRGEIGVRAGRSVMRDGGG